MIDPGRAVDLAGAMRDLYGEAELEMVERVARRVERGIDQPGWAERKLAEVGALQRELDGVVARVDRDGAELLPELLAGAHRQGLAAAAAVVGDSFDLVRVNAGAVEALAAARLSGLQGTHFAILRSASDAYRSAVADASGLAVTGVYTRRDAAQAALRRFADAGVTGFVDARGRRWDLGSYTEMATRSAIAQSYLEAHVGALAGRGRDLVIVSDSPDECPRCRPWEGKVLSISGADPSRTSLAEARAGGLFHASCTHTIGLYVPGLTRLFTNTSDAVGNAERAEQRANERQIRRWRRRHAAAITPLERRRATAQLKAWQERQRVFIARTGRRRDYGRESVRDTAVAARQVSSGDRIQDQLDHAPVRLGGQPLGASGINTTQPGIAGSVDVVLKPQAGLHTGSGSSSPLRQGIPDGTDLEREMAANVMRRFLDDLVDTPRVAIRDVPGLGPTLLLERRASVRASALETPLSERISAGLFDSVIGNTDRHGGNLLVERVGRRYHLILIDHGLAFPEATPTWGNMAFLRGHRLRASDRRRLQRVVRQESDVRAQLAPLVGDDAVNELFRRVRFMLAEGRQLTPVDFLDRPWRGL